ncbi:MAG: rRNA maturation RNase YbeY [Deltaproteobacteria bacterium RBG_13_52_11]|nr:MAG: rRNA maturation RNase YbeY [Deltaproteobacteria bacterium RBG_13_52_11]
MEVVVQSRQKRQRVRPGKAKKMAEGILNDLGYHECELSILLVDDDEMTQLNREYLSRDHPTNVLAFAMREGEDKDLHPALLGDVVVSTETAQREALQRGVTLEEEMALLITHGILHLLGYDHEGAPEEAVKMEAKEQEILARLGLTENKLAGE